MSIWTPATTWTWGRFRLGATPGFCLLLAALCWLDEGVGLLGWSLLACGVHEGGHLLAARLAGARPRSLRLSAVGAELALDRPLSYRREFWVALAGPAANGLLSLGAAALGGYLLAGMSLSLALFNLLPAGGLDGGRLLRCLLGALGLEAEPWLTGLSALLGGLLLGLGLVLLGAFGNVTLLLTALWLLAGTLAPRR